MSDALFDQVARLAEQLSPVEKQRLIRLLEGRPPQSPLTDAEWDAMIQSITIDRTPGPRFSLRREDWYDDDGR